MMVSFIIAGAVCAVAALCYSELASMVPVAGSAYTYSYAVMGEIVAWMVGWALILEYALGASAVAVGWSGISWRPAQFRRGPHPPCVEGGAADPVGLPPGRRGRRPHQPAGGHRRRLRHHPAGHRHQGKRHVQRRPRRDQDRGADPVPDDHRCR